MRVAPGYPRWCRFAGAHSLIFFMGLTLPFSREHSAAAARDVTLTSWMQSYGGGFQKGMRFNLARTDWRDWSSVIALGANRESTLDSLIYAAVI